MQSLDKERVETVFAMFKGEPGTRKSTQALSFPTPQYWFPTDGKMNALVLPAKYWGVSLADVHYDKYTDYNSVIKKLNEFQLKCPYKTLVIDSITSMADVINRQTIKLKSGTTTKDGAEKGIRVGGIPVNSLEDYKAEASAFQELIAVCKDIQVFHKINIILIAHVIGDRPVSAGDQTHFARIIITGGKTISGKIPAYCDETYHFNVEADINADMPGKYGCLTVHTGADFARTALPLERKIIFGDKPLYAGWIKPAMDKLNAQQVLTKL